MNKWNHPEKLGSILENILSERGYHTICKEYEVVSRWKEIVGERISEVTECSRVEDGILYVNVSTAPWRQEMVFLKQEILKQIKKVTGCDTIKDIIFG